MSSERPGRLAGVLRLPRRTLGASADQQSDREHVRDGAIANEQNQGRRQPNGFSGHGIQTGGGGSESLGQTQRERAAVGGGGRGDLQGWNKTRRLRLSGHPRHLTVARSSFPNGSSCWNW